MIEPMIESNKLTIRSKLSNIPNTVYPDIKWFYRTDNPQMPMPSRTVNCPQCGTLVIWESDNRFRPFCSKRCKMIDLSQWAQESYRIPNAESSSNNSQPGESE